MATILAVVGWRGWQRRRIWSSATSGAPSCSRALLRSPIPHYSTSAVGTRRGLEKAGEKRGPLEEETGGTTGAPLAPEERKY